MATPPLVMPSWAQRMVDPRSGVLTTEWYQFLWKLFQVINSGGGGGAPSTAVYILGAVSGSLPNGRVLTDTASIDVDLGTPAQAKFHVLVDPAGALEAGPLAVKVDGVTVQINGDNALEAIAAGGWVPLALGTEPLTFVSDGAGQPVLVAYP